MKKFSNCKIADRSDLKNSSRNLNSQRQSVNETFKNIAIDFANCIKLSRKILQNAIWTRNLDKSFEIDSKHEEQANIVILIRHGDKK